ncbi:GNAT family N-acetyltransferase [Thermoflavimicrobium dichotomicum]|uniref:N-acetylglutamate synthase, GNAT family n=1 Tax=Thermoflavimicrobium dichotomicum TaxID=46223 RepID=A0A1I3P408_9BACL|nr:GNAT family N-acetyltransferase [Thermoflavimicrobium dichotomicum]SFJ16295.1 N-acetylglutamate synthase, GNAT family [Thermoflavimicrobium dichotomicum]
MNLRLQKELPDCQQFFDLYQTTGWKHPFNDQQLFQAISNSWFTLSAYKNQELIGFGRIISDGIYQALICDLIVKPEFRNHGVGTTILRALLEECRQHNILLVSLFSARGKSDFYKKFGFVERDASAPGMIWDQTKSPF